jgi:hypothetical protein
MVEGKYAEQFVGVAWHVLKVERHDRTIKKAYIAEIEARNKVIRKH